MVHPSANAGVRADDAPLDPSLRDAFVAAGARACTIANTLAVTTDDALARTIAGAGDVEHLEAYAVARACRLSSPRVDCAIVLGITNTVGRSGRHEWRANHVHASAKVAELAAAAIHELQAAFKTSTTARSPG
jgi:hypothetical protein